MQTTPTQVADHLLLTIQIAPTDYMPSFLKDVKTYAQQVNTKGFRPSSQGHLALVKKRYGQMILKDILSKKIEEAIENFLVKEKLLLVDNYSLKEEFEQINTEKPSGFTFAVELVTVPDFTLPPFKEIEVKDYKISSVSPEDIDNYIKMKQRLYSEEMVQQPKVRIHDHVKGYFTDRKDHLFTFLVDQKIEQHTSIVGKQKGDSVTFSKEAKAMLPLHIFYWIYQSYDVLKKDEDHHFVITDIAEEKTCALDQAFFDKCAGAVGKVKNLTEFKKLMQESLLEDLQDSADLLLEDNIIKAYQKKLNIKIPHYTGHQALVRIKRLIIDKLLKTKSFDIHLADMIPKLMELSTLAHINPSLSFDSKEVQQRMTRDVEAALANPESESYQQAYYSALVGKSMAFIKENITLNKEKISVKAFKDMLIDYEQRLLEKD